jgi:hypothetical protein
MMQFTVDCCEYLVDVFIQAIESKLQKKKIGKNRKVSAPSHQKTKIDGIGSRRGSRIQACGIDSSDIKKKLVNIFSCNYFTEFWLKTISLFG